MSSKPLCSSQVIICPGAQKAGTTTLFDLLGQHNDIELTSIKETKYFLQPFANLDRGEYFHSYFGHKTDSKILCEVDPDYQFFPHVAKNLRGILGPDIKFIFLLRNPVDRAYSHFWMSKLRGFETEDFKRALELEESRLKGMSNLASSHQSYFSRGLYSEQIERYLRHFRRENMHFVLFEEFVQNTDRELRKILRFLRIDDSLDSIDTSIKSREGRQPRSEFLARLHGQPMAIKSFLRKVIPSRNLRWSFYPIVERINVSNKKPEKMDPEFRRALARRYEEDIKRLTELLNLNLSVWQIS